MMPVITDNIFDMTNDISQLHALLQNFFSSSYSVLSLFHDSYFASVINVAKREEMKITNANTDDVWSLTNAVRA